MTKDKVTIYSFKLKPGISENDLIACGKKINALMQTQPGFQYRSMSKTEDGLWLDINYWGAAADAQKIGAVFEGDASGQALMAMIDMNSLTVYRTEVGIAACVSEAVATA